MNAAALRILMALVVVAALATHRGGAALAEPTPAPTASSASAASDRIALRRTLVFTGLSGEPDSLNPLVSVSGPGGDTGNFSHLYLSHLLECDDRGRLIGELAARVPTQANGDISADGRTIVYHLRPHLMWQDGVPLTARDVVFTYEAVMNAATNVPERLGYVQVDRIRAPDDRTVSIRLKVPYAPILDRFGGPGGYPILPAHLLAHYRSLDGVPFNALPVGSGPYRVVEWRRADAVVLAANPTYWRGKPHIERLVFRITPDPTTRLLQLQTGESAVYFDADPQLLPQLTALPDVHVSLNPVNDLHVVMFNLADPVSGDPRVRQAIARAIDRDKLIEVATHGSGVRIDGDQPVNGWGHAAGLPAIAYDPAAARKLLDGAGWRVSPGGTRVKAGRRLELSLVISPQAVNGSTLVATVIQRYLQDVGISASIKPYEPAVLFGPRAAGGILAAGRYQLAYTAWWVFGPDPDDSWNFACDQRPPAGVNWSGWCNRRADTALAAATRSYDQAGRKREYAIVQAELRRDLPIFTLWQVKMPDALRATIRGFAPSPFGSTFWNAWAWSL